MRLIDADAVKFNFQYGRDDNGILLVPYRDAKKLIEAAKTVDAVPLVRCKDCKWFADNNDGSWYGCWLFQTIQIIPEDAPKPDDFCSYGERRENNG